MRLILAILLTAVSAFAQGDVEDLMLLRVPEVVSGVSPSSLVTNLVAYYRLDEQSGTRYDAVGTNHLTSVNNVGYMTGISTNAALVFSNASQYLSAPDSPELSIDRGSFTIAFAVNRYVTNVEQFIAGKAGGAGDREWFFSFESSSAVTFRVFTNGTGTRDITSIVKPTTNEWHRIIGMYSTNAQSSYIIVDSTAAIRTNSVLEITADGTTTQPLNIGRAGTAYSKYIDGGVDEFAFWKRALSWTEITNLLNNMSNGLSYPWTGQP